VAFEHVSVGNILPGPIVLSTIELEDLVLPDLSAGELDHLKTLTDNASKILWITAGGLSTSEKPEFSLSRGFLRSLGVEQPSLKLFLLDLHDITINKETAVRQTVDVFLQAMEKKNPELEYIQHDDALYCGRFFSNVDLTERLHHAQTGHITPTALENAGAIQISIGLTGQLDSLHFVQNAKREEPLKADHVEVEVRCVGVNAKACFQQSWKDELSR
jgi:hypothetical protein